MGAYVDVDSIFGAWQPPGPVARAVDAVIDAVDEVVGDIRNAVATLESEIEERLHGDN